LGSGHTIPETDACPVAERFILSADLYDLASAYRWTMQTSSPCPCSPTRRSTRRPEHAEHQSAHKRVAGGQACGGGHRRPRGCRRRRGSTPGARRSRQEEEEEEEGPALTPPENFVPPVLTTFSRAGTIGSRWSEREKGAPSWP